MLKEIMDKIIKDTLEELLKDRSNPKVNEIVDAIIEDNKHVCV